MFIQTETTPNPATLKFLPGLVVLADGNRNFDSKDNAVASPLAQRLFEVEGVQGVFFGRDFITITKVDDREWFLMKPSILGIIMEHFTAGRAVLADDVKDDDADSGVGHASDQDDNQIVIQIKELLDTRVRPAVAMDGGDIVFHSFEDGVVYLAMQGACSGCPSSTMTLKHGIENMLKHYVPEVNEVQSI